MLQGMFRQGVQNTCVDVLSDPPIWPYSSLWKNCEQRSEQKLGTSTTSLGMQKLDRWTRILINILTNTKATQNLQQTLQFEQRSFKRSNIFAECPLLAEVARCSREAVRSDMESLYTHDNIHQVPL